MVRIVWGAGTGGVVPGQQPRGTGAPGCCSPCAPWGDAVGHGWYLVCMQAGSPCRGSSLVLLLFLCCSFSLLTTWTHALGTAVALWVLHLQPMPQPELLPSLMSTQPPPTPTQPGGGVLPEAGGSGLRPPPATVSSRPGCSDGPALPACHPRPSGSPLRACAPWPWARFPFGWDAQNQIWCLFF